MHELTQATLRDAGNVPIHRHDPVEMNGLTFKIILTQNFKLRMIDKKTPVDFLQFSMRNHLLARRKDLVHERHVVPTAGDPRGTKETAIRIDQHRFEKPFALTKTPLRGIDDLRTKTN